MVGNDLSPGEITAQAVHAAFMFARQYPELTNSWMDISNNICVLEASTDQLKLLMEKASNQKVKISIFEEPDLNKITAVALEPSDTSKKLCSNFKLALRDYKCQYCKGYALPPVKPVIKNYTIFDKLHFLFGGKL